MAALASAAMPNAVIAGARASEQNNATDEGYGIDHAVVQDSVGRLYDTLASNTPEGRPVNWVDSVSMSIGCLLFPMVSRKGPPRVTFP